MNNVQISTLIDQCPLVRSKFDGIFALDTLPPVPLKDKTYICNLDPSDEPGSHWISIYTPSNGPSEYFDSYGLDAPAELEKSFLQPDYIYNQRSLQSPLSSVCGQYSLYFIWQRPLQESMNITLEIFDECYQYYNDWLVNRLIEEHFDF